MSDFQLRKQQIEVQLAEYERDIAAYAKFMEGWRNRNDPSHQRLERFRNAAMKRAGTGER